MPEPARYRDHPSHLSLPAAAVNTLRDAQPAAHHLTEPKGMDPEPKETLIIKNVKSKAKAVFEYLLFFI